jgi:hypothetical protein
MRSIRIRYTVIAVMEQEDIAMLCFLNPPDNSSGRLGIPIAAGNGPHYNFGQTHLLRCGLKLGTTEAERRSNQRHRFPCRRTHRVLATPQFGNDLSLGEENNTRMTVGVIPDRVFSRDHFPHQ